MTTEVYESNRLAPLYWGLLAGFMTLLGGLVVDWLGGPSVGRTIDTLTLFKEEGEETIYILPDWASWPWWTTPLAIVGLVAFVALAVKKFKTHEVADGLGVGLVFGLVFGLVVGLGVGLVFGLVVGLGVGLDVGLGVGLVAVIAATLFAGAAVGLVCTAALLLIAASAYVLISIWQAASGKQRPTKLSRQLRRLFTL